MRNRRPDVGTQESPCIKICRIKDDYCIGCLRSMEEIRSWPIMTNEEQVELLKKLQWRMYG